MLHRRNYRRSPAVANFEVIVGVGTSAPMSMRLPLDIHWHHDELSVPHAALGDDVIADMPDGIGSTAHQNHLHATPVVEIDTRRRNHEVVVLCPNLGQPLRQLAHVAIVNIDERRDAKLAAHILVGAELLKAGPDDVPHGLGPALIAPLLHELVDLGNEVVVESESDALH
jgi:hypothetical protein